MVTEKVIEEIYKQYSRRPSSPDLLDIPLLFSDDIEQHKIDLTDDHIVINSLDSRSPFHSISINRVHEILNFEKVIAIVLHSSIIFLNKHDSGVNVHIRMNRPSLLDHIQMKLSKP